MAGGYACQCCQCCHRQAIFQREPIQLRALVEEVWRPLASKAAEKRIHWEHKTPPELVVFGDRRILIPIIGNLLDNAVSYAPQGGPIRGRVSITNGCAVLHLSNQTEGLEARDVIRLFDRFWRKEHSRSDAKHTGLGLALARALARAHGNDLSARLEPDSWLVLSLSLVLVEDETDQQSPTPNI